MPVAQLSTPAAPTAFSDVLAAVRHLPAMPATAAALLRLGDVQQVSLAQLCAAVHGDPAITLRVLRAANSPFYGVPGGVLTLEDAVVVLGSTTLRSLALTAALASALQGDPAADGQPDPVAFWRPALGCAVLASVFSEPVLIAPDTAFTCGLLHNIGELAWATVAPADHQAARQAAGAEQRSLAAVCRSRFGWEPFALGAALIRHWGLPERLAAVIAQLAAPQCEDQRHPQQALLSLLRLGMALAAQLPATAAGAPLPDDQVLLAWVDGVCPPGSPALAALDALQLPAGALLASLKTACRQAGMLDQLLS